MTDKTATDMAVRIKALLAKAEGTDNPAEADAYNAKAAELSAKWGIDSAMISAAKPKGQQEEIIQVDVIIGGPYPMDKMRLMAAIGRPLRVDSVYWWTHNGTRWDIKLGLVGFTSDIKRTKILYESLVLQSVSRAASAEVPYGESPRAFRRSHMWGFRTAIEARLNDAELRAAHDHDADTGTPGTELVLADRRTQVSKAFGQMYPNTRNSSGTVRTSGFGAGRQAGYEASLGGPSVGGHKAQIG